MELGFLQCVVTISLVCTGMVSPRWGHQEETRSVGVQGERKGAWPLDAPPPQHTHWKVLDGRGGFITPLSKALPKDHKEQESGRIGVYVWWGWGGESSRHKGSSW